MTTFNVRRLTAALYTSTNPTLDIGEPACEVDTGKWKFGDGVTPWTSLGYVPTGQPGPWIALTVVSPWTSGGGGEAVPSYQLSASGHHIDLAGWVATGTANTTAFAMPSAVRPLTLKTLGAYMFNLTYASALKVYPNSAGGVVVPSGTSCSLDGLGYPLDI